MSNESDNMTYYAKKKTIAREFYIVFELVYFSAVFRYYIVVHEFL